MIAVAGCLHGAGSRGSAPLFQPAGAFTEVTLFRDAALVRERLEVSIGSGAAAVPMPVPADATELTVVDRGGLAIASVHLADGRATLDVSAPHAGHYKVDVAYVTTGMRWLAAYTLVTTPARDRAVLHGALAVTNALGFALPHAALRLVDASLAEWRDHEREQLVAGLVGASPSTTPVAPLRDLGEVALARGETLVALPGISAPRPMRSVLVYDPVGTSHDHEGAIPQRDEDIGVSPPAPPAVSESLEIERDATATAGLPAGPATLYEARDGGALALLAESSLFGAATRVAPVDTIPIGTAIGVTAHRERRDLTVEDDAKRHRITEEFVITVDNQRDRPVAVVVREHLYRGLTWVVAYESTKHPTKEGAQQIALRTDVPAKGKAEVAYVVVYSWKP